MGRQISYWLIDAFSRNKTFAGKSSWLQGDAITMIVAGRYAHHLTSGLDGLTKSSDTLAPTLVFLFYELARNKALTEELRLELKTVTSIQDTNDLQSLPLLNGFINETVRLYPAVPTGGYRESPIEGITIAGQRIPEGTTIVAPRYSIGRRR